ncbi:hypothetical protein [Salinisphaera sp. T31B1]|uniref:phage tail fiber protein n=1 Tax=Salinisphaera sp. T31B1 TaxID=727963 RepID=UPI0033425AA6
MAVYNDASPNKVADQALGGHKYVPAADSAQGVSSQLDINFEEWKRRALLRIAVEAGMDPASDSDMLLSDSIYRMIDGTPSRLTGIKLLADQDDLLQQSPGWYGWTNPAPINGPPSNTPTYQIAHIANAGNRNYKITAWSTGDQETWTNYKVFAGWTGWDKSYTTRNTTVDGNGNLSPASPIFRVATKPYNATGGGYAVAGAGTANSYAAGVTCEHPATGIYIVRGSLGLRREGWYIKTPLDTNYNPKCYVEYDQHDDGTIEIRTYEPVANGPFVAGGEPMDIPAGRWIDLRLEMPEPEQPAAESETE